MIKRAWFLNQSIKEICDFDQFIILFILIYVFVLNFKNITIRKSEFKSFRVKSN